MSKLEQFFGLAPGELIPGYVPDTPYERQIVDPSGERYMITRLARQPGFAVLHVNAEVPVGLANEIGDKLDAYFAAAENDDAADRT